MTSLIPSVSTSSVNQGAPIGSYATPTTVQGLPDDFTTLLTPEELEAMTDQETKDLQEFLESQHFQMILDDQECADEDLHEEPNSNQGYTQEYLLNKQTAYGAGAALMSYLAWQGAKMAGNKAIAIHNLFAETLRAERRAEAAARTANGQPEVVPERSLGLRAFVATGERIGATQRVLKRLAGAAKDWYSATGSTVGRSSAREQLSTEATSTGK